MNVIPFDAKVRQVVAALKIKLLKLACRIFGPKFGAAFIVANANWDGWESGRPTVIALYRPLFSKDLIELRKRTNLNWVFINNEFLGHVQSAWLPKEMQFQTKYQSYKNTNIGAWLALEKFGCALVKRLQSKTKIDAFMTSHIDYWQAEGARLGAKLMNIPFLGLCREHMCLPIEQRSVTSYYSNFKFEGDAIAVFGEATRRIFIDSGACYPEQVVVTGAPRLDIWRDIIDENETGNYITLLSYRDPDYRAPNSFAETLKLFLLAANKHENSGLIFHVKSKNPQDSDEIRGMAKKLPSNVVIDHTAVLPDLLRKSRMTIGFNSLSLLEAHFTNTTIVVPYWSDARRHADELIFDPDDAVTQKVIQFPTSAEEFSGLIDRAVAGECNNMDVADRLAIIRKVFYFPESTTCCEQVEVFVRSRMRN